MLGCCLKKQATPYIDPLLHPDFSISSYDLYHLLSNYPHYTSHVHLFSDTPPRYLAGQWEAKEILGIRCLAPLQSTDETQIFVLPASARVEGTYPLVNIQKAIENGHRNTGFTH